MLRKFFLMSVLAGLSLMTTARAEETRAFWTTENKFPELGQAEVSYWFEQNEYEDFVYRSHSALLRYGLIENVTARLDVPWVQRDEDFAADADGLGDVGLGFDLLAYEDIFRYPYVIPHVDIAFPTGDDDDGLGTGETMYMFGVSIGTVVYDVLHYVFDASYAMNYDARATEEDDVFMGSLSLIWDISDRFSVMGEGRIMDFQDTSDQPFLIGAGMTYGWTENLYSSFFIGNWQESDFGQDQELMVRASYTF